MKRTPLKRSKKPIRKVSQKRAPQLRQYTKDRLDFLEKNPWCQIYIRRFNIDPAEVREHNGAYKVMNLGTAYWKMVPLATDIHHVRGRVGLMLLDQKYWMSACREQHDWAHANGKQARLQGIIQ